MKNKLPEAGERYVPRKDKLVYGNLFTGLQIKHVGAKYVICTVDYLDSEEVLSIKELLRDYQEEFTEENPMNPNGMKQKTHSYFCEKCAKENGSNMLNYGFTISEQLCPVCKQNMGIAECRNWGLGPIPAPENPINSHDLDFFIERWNSSAPLRKGYIQVARECELWHRPSKTI